MLGLLLQNIDSTIYFGIRQLLLGPDESGDPTAGMPVKNFEGREIPGTRGGFVGRTKLINGDKTTTFRELRPLDNIVGGTAGNYATVVATGTNYTQICIGTAPPVARQIPPGQSVLIIGWYLNGDLGTGGCLRVVLNNILRNEACADMVYAAFNHTLLTLTQMVFAVPNDQLEISAFNSTGADVTCVVFPIAFLIGPAAQLGLEAPPTPI